MGKKYYGVAIGRVPGIYTTWSLANTQTEGYSGACHAGFDEMASCVDFMIAKDFNEDDIRVIGQRGGQYTIRNWQRKVRETDDEDGSTSPPDDPYHLVVQLPEISSPDTPRYADDQTQPKCVDPPSSSSEATSDVSDPFRDLLNSVNEKMCHIQTTFTIIKTMAKDQATLKDENAELKALMLGMKSGLDNHQKQRQKRDAMIAKLQDALIQKDKAHSDLMGTLLDLRAQNAKLTTEQSRSKWESFHTTSEQHTVLIGSSIIRDIDQHKLLNTDVKCRPGAKISDLIDELKCLPDGKYSHIILVGGGNDSSDTKDPAAVVNSFKDMISAAKAKTASVAVASVCPRGDPEVQECINNVNAAVQGMCEDLSCTYYDVTDILKLADGAINEGFYLDDLVHLTYKGQNKLAMKLNLKPTQTDTPYNVVSNQKTRPKPSHSRTSGESAQPVTTSTDRELTSTSRRRDDMYRPTYTHRDERTNGAYQRRDERSTTYQRRDQRDQRDGRLSQSSDNNSSNMRCKYCAEPHHREDRCHHMRPVKCHICGFEGHKSKYCETNITNGVY